MPSPLEVAKQLKEGKELKLHFADRREVNDFEYEVLKKLLDLYENDMKEASRSLCKLKSTPTQ
jgi:hypothetical protein